MKKAVNNFAQAHRAVPFFIAILFLIISVVGLADASYLTYVHYANAPLSCSVLSGCELVTTSAYATIIGIPVALLGAFYYFSLFALALVYLITKQKKIFIAASYLTINGLLASLWFLYVQFFVINAVCIYCLGSAASSIILFILGFGIILHYRR